MPTAEDAAAAETTFRDWQKKALSTAAKTAAKTAVRLRDESLRVNDWRRREPVITVNLCRFALLMACIVYKMPAPTMASTMMLGESVFTQWTRSHVSPVYRARERREPDDNEHA
jgi:hypothetical protein